MASNDDRVYCPVLDREIEDIDCIENRDIVDGNLDERFLAEGFRKRKDWKSACRKCEWHNY